MNFLRGQVCSILRRPLYRHFAIARPFTPPSQLASFDPSRPKELDESTVDALVDEAEEEPEDGEGVEDDQPKSHPESSSFYTARPSYYDNILELQNAISRTRGSLQRLHLLPLPEFARKSLKPMPTVWKTPEEMTADFETNMTISRYRRVTTLLNELNEYYRIATTAGYPDIAERIGSIVTMFESGKKEAYLARGVRKRIHLDQHGRSYTFGKRKTSTARVWMIPVKEVATKAFGLDNTPSRPPVNVTASTILINNLSIAEYFPQPLDRERIVRKYNVFIIVRGGGTTGQSGAIAHGIAKGVFAHDPETGTVLKRGPRDPRMVERKKTGLAKARKAYTWVKR
ncbi:ribosomal protein S5 domain 2-like protein [Gymnopus androsaceus JB14]|uniref:Ribosomal protein S5 domain 2-like protein n=1 Tax=Gymnopus androsaceus JB14 TaxID=1447944 RepID=A0A6A4ITX6_9AGAR|nr:ribosomal protein S5 domain 2-like protein [Gymnopus androsaceus JB14]